MKSYRDLDVFKISFELAMKIHEISLRLPKFEQYEEASQIRRSSKSVTSNIVEGYGRRKYVNDFVKFLIYAQASCLETSVHLEFIYKSGYIDESHYRSLADECEVLGKKLSAFIRYVRNEWKT